MLAARRIVPRRLHLRTTSPTAVEIAGIDSTACKATSSRTPLFVSCAISTSTEHQGHQDQSLRQCYVFPGMLRDRCRPSHSCIKEYGRFPTFTEYPATGLLTSEPTNRNRQIFSLPFTDIGDSCLPIHRRESARSLAAQIQPEPE